MAVARGSIVAVPLVGRLTMGVVWGEPKDNFAHNRLKDIEVIYDAPPLSDELLRTVDWVARYTLAPPGLVLRSVLRSSEALEPERPVTAFRKTGIEPERHDAGAAARARDRRRWAGLGEDARSSAPAACRPRSSRGSSGPGRWSG